MSERTKLTVKPLKQKDAGRGLAAIDRRAMANLGLENGDYIVIEGKNQGRAVARVWPGYPEDEGQQVIRIDGRPSTRQRQDLPGRVQDFTRLFLSNGYPTVCR